MQQRHVLIVYPHPDDESFGKAGTVALLAQQGVPVTYICGTLGQLGRNMGKPPVATRESLPMTREQELREACEILGIKDLRLWRMRDKTLEFEDKEELADKIQEVIREVNPSLVISYYPKHGVHPDHNAMAAATFTALKRIPKEERPLFWGSPVTKEPEKVLGPPSEVIDVSSVRDVKVAAIRAHRSQSSAMLADLEKRIATDPQAKETLYAMWDTERYWVVPVE